MSDTPKLLPCPFCGTFAEIYHNHVNEKYVVECGTGNSDNWEDGIDEYTCPICPKTRYYEEAEDAIDEWNRRAVPAWSSDPPTENGWYWWYNNGEVCQPTLVPYFGGKVALVGLDGQSDQVCDISEFGSGDYWTKAEPPELPPSE